MQMEHLFKVKKKTIENTDRANFITREEDFMKGSEMKMLLKERVFCIVQMKTRFYMKEIGKKGSIMDQAPLITLDFKNCLYLLYIYVFNILNKKNINLIYFI